MRLIFHTLIIVISCCFALPAFSKLVKTAEVDLLLERENIHNVVIDEARGYVYFELIGARGSSTAPLPYSHPYSISSALKKIYVAPIDGGGIAKPLFDQDGDAGYYFASADPWSPSGRYLAIVRFKEGKAQPGVFDLQRSRAKFFDITSRYEPVVSSLVWVTNSVLAFFNEQQAHDSFFDKRVYSARALAEAREKGWRYGEVTAEIVGTGKYGRRTAPEAYDLVTVDVRNGNIKTLMGSSSPFLTAPVTLSNRVVMAEEILRQQGPYARHKKALERVLSVVDFSTGANTLIKSGEEGSSLPLLWSASGRYLLIQHFIRPKEGKPSETILSIVDTSSAEIVEHLPQEAASFAWVGDRLIYTLDEREELRSKHEASGLAIQVNTPPAVAADADLFYFLKDGDLWSADLDGVYENLTQDQALVLQPHRNARGNQYAPTMAASARHTPSLDQVAFIGNINKQQMVVSFSADGNTMNVVPFPHQESKVLANSSKGAVFLDNEYGMGSTLRFVRVGVSSTPVLLYHYNIHLADVKPAVGPIPIVHKAYDGRDVRGWLFLPPDAPKEGGQRYPLVVLAYPGFGYDAPPINRAPFARNFWDLSLSTNTQMEVFVAHGYAVLLPSVPLESLRENAVLSGEAGEPMTRIMPAIDSALDAAIETGFVDPNRLALSGQSGGGFLALSVAVQTDRFKGIIAMASYANGTSQYGQFFPIGKINGTRLDPPGGAWTSLFEGGVGRMEAPPWGDPDRYVRNGPLFHVDKVKTPMMLIHGDLDTATHVTQAEEMFTGLHREAKDAVFVKYVGEQHIIVQPQNQRDMWQRIFKFLEDNGIVQ